MAVIGHGQSALIATFSAVGNDATALKKMDFKVPMKQTPIDSANASKPSSGTNYTQDPVYLWTHHRFEGGLTGGCIKLGIHATGSYYYGQEYKEFLWFNHPNGGAIQTLSTQTGDNYSSFNSSSNFSLAIQDAANGILRVTQDKDLTQSNEVKVYYLGGGTDVTFVGRNSGQPSGLGSIGADYDDRWYQTFWIV